MQRFILDVGAATDVGKQRKRNEDSVSVFTPPTAEPNPSQLGGLLLVADGMGGERAGDRASQMTAERLEQWFVSGSYRDWPEHAGETPLETTLIRAVRGISHEIYELGEADETIRGLGSTVVLALLTGKRLVIAHVGDSRAYLVRGGAIRQLTTDHSWVQRQVEVGMISAEDARRHPQRNILTRSLGDSLPPDVDVGTLEVDDGDLFVLCSDGLTGGVTDEEILAITQRGLTPSELAVALVDLANDQDGSDNITVAVGRCRTVSGLAWQESETGPIVAVPIEAPGVDAEGAQPADALAADALAADADATQAAATQAAATQAAANRSDGVQTRLAFDDTTATAVAASGAIDPHVDTTAIETATIESARPKSLEDATLESRGLLAAVSGDSALDSQALHDAKTGELALDTPALDAPIRDAAPAGPASAPTSPASAPTGTDSADPALDRARPADATPALDQPLERTLFSEDRIVQPPILSEEAKPSPKPAASSPSAEAAGSASAAPHHDGETEVHYFEGDTEIDLLAPPIGDDAWREPPIRGRRSSRSSWSTWILVGLLALAAGLLVGYLLGNQLAPGPAPAPALERPALESPPVANPAAESPPVATPAGESPPVAGPAVDRPAAEAPATD